MESLALPWLSSNTERAMCVHIFRVSMSQLTPKIYYLAMIGIACRYVCIPLWEIRYTFTYHRYSYEIRLGSNEILFYVRIIPDPQYE